LKLKRKWHSEDNILGRRTILKRMLKNNVNYAVVAQQRSQQCALLNRTTQLWKLKKEKKVLTNLAGNRLSIRNLLHNVS
jgi:hypothetical protein